MQTKLIYALKSYHILLRHLLHHYI